MTLSEFKIELNAQVDQFISEYTDCNRENPDHYPIEFDSAADWWEQFDMSFD